MKKILILSLLTFISFSYADLLNESNVVKNNPTVGSLQYSGALFPDQNSLTNNPANYGNTNNPNNQNLSYYNKNNSASSFTANSPTVNSKIYSGAQFPQQNAITKNQAQYNNGKEQNNPFVNSRLYSGAQFPEQNNY